MSKTRKFKSMTGEIKRFRDGTQPTNYRKVMRIQRGTARATPAALRARQDRQEKRKQAAAEDRAFVRMVENAA